MRRPAPAAVIDGLVTVPRQSEGGHRHIKTLCCLVIALCAVVVLSMPEPARTQDDETRHEYRIEAGPLGRALNQLATQSRIQLLYEPELVADRTVPSLVGELTVPEALNALLQGSGLVPYHVNGNTIVLRPAPPNPSRGEDTETGAIRGTVTLPDGSPASGVQVTATSRTASDEKTTHTDERGRYTLSDLPPGRYALTFEHEGMAAAERKKTTTVSPGEEIQIDFSFTAAPRPSSSHR